MKRIATTVVVIAALVLAAGNALTQEDPQSDDLALNSYLGVTVYPGSVLVSQDTETEFESSASLQEVYAFIHDQLVALDWERTDLTENSDEVEARYTRGEETLAIDLEQEDENRYDLETDLDD